MNKKWIIAGVILFGLVVLGGSYVSSYNRLIIAEENVDISWAQLEKVLQRDPELEATQNLIAVEQRRYNEAVRQYNILTKRFPTNIIARIMSFEPRSYFEAASF